MIHSYTIRELTIEEAIEIYKKWMRLHFPPDELRPLKSLKDLWAKKNYRGYGIFAGEKLSGYAFFTYAPDCKFALLDYFAMIQEQRGQGIGTRFFQELKKKMYGFQGILIETESVESAENEEQILERQRRNAFYERGGARKTGIVTNVYGVEYCIWNYSIEMDVTDEKCREAMEKIYHNMLPDELYEKYVKVDVVAETSAYQLFKRQGEYTIEDYYELPDDVRMELIDGVFYYLGAPKAKHQVIAGEIHRQISNQIRARKGGCVPFLAPFDVQLDRDEYTVVQPDLVIICRKDLLKDGHAYGAPDWVLEVLSPSTRKKDCVKKLDKYMEAGVREYWIVDPRYQLVTVYDFENDNFPIHYSFTDQIPIQIYKGELTVDMNEVVEMLDMLNFGEA